MYPTLYDLILDLFGIDFAPLKLVQSYGMMVALGFVFGSIIITLELKRKEKIGELQSTFRKVWKGKKSSVQDKATSTLIGFIVGFKLAGLFVDFEIVIERPQDFLLSFQGSVLGGIVGAAIALAIQLLDDRKNALAKPTEVEEEVHPHEHIGNIAILAGVGGISGAKLFHNLENWDEMMADPMTALLSFSGLSFFGGLICATALVIWYARKKGIKILPLMDSGMPAIVIGYAFGRSGCQIAGDGDWGIPNDNPMPEWLSFLPDWVWAYDYPNNVLGVDMIQYFAKNGYTSLTGFAYPTPIYEIIMCTIVFIFLWSMRKRWATPGVMIAAYLILTGAERLLIEQIRINNEYDILGGVTQAEIISVIMMGLGAFGMWYMPKVGKKWAEW